MLFAVMFLFYIFNGMINRLKNKLLASYLKSSGNELETVRFSAFCNVWLSNNSIAKVAKILEWAKRVAIF